MIETTLFIIALASPFVSGLCLLVWFMMNRRVIRKYFEENFEEEGK